MLSPIARHGLRAHWRADAALPALEYPLPAAERIAVVGARFAAQPGVRSFHHWRTPDLEAWRPQALAGPRAELFAIGALRRQQYLALPELRFPLVVFSALPEGPLSPEHHERLWQLFGLPVYEQIRGEDECLLGWECDARDGWHLACEADGAPRLLLLDQPPARWRGSLSQGLCGCGRSGLKLIVDSQVRCRVPAAAAAPSARVGSQPAYSA